MFLHINFIVKSRLHGRVGAEYYLTENDYNTIGEVQGERGWRGMAL